MNARFAGRRHCPPVSIVICTQDRLEPLRHALHSLRRQTWENFEVIAVVGPDSDSTRRYLHEEHMDVRILDCPVANLSVARNLGWRDAASGWIGFLDDDAVALPDWIERLREPFSDLRVAAAGGFVRDRTGGRYEHEFLTIDPLCNAESLPTGRYRGPIVTAGPYDSEEPRFKYPAGANMMLRRAALVAVGGFDETYAYGADDADISLRLYARGFAVAHVPAAQVVHASAPSRSRDNDGTPRALRDPTRSFVYFRLRHGARFLAAGRVMESVARHVADTHERVDALAAAGRLGGGDAQRLHREIDEGTREALEASLAAPPIGLPAGTPPATAPAFRPFAILRSAPSRLRLCLVAKQLPPARSGGIGVWTWTLARGLARLGHEVSVLSRGAGAASLAFVDGCWVHRSAAPRYETRCKPDVTELPQPVRDNALRVYDQIRSLETERPFDVVSAPIWEAEGLACLRARHGLTAVSLHTPLRAMMDATPDWQPDARYMRTVAAPIFAAEAELAVRSSLVLANSRHIVAEIERAYGVTIPRERLHIVPHGIDDVPATPPRPASPRTLLFVGRFEQRKGIDIVLDAIPEILSRHPDIVFMLCGDTAIPADGGPYLERFMARFPGAPWLGRVVVRGWLDDEALLEAYRGCDVLVAPSRFESFGLIFLEAMRCAKPVIALDRGGAREVLEHGATALLLADERPATLAGAVALLLADDALRCAMGRRARAAFEQRYTAARMAETVAEIFLAASRRGAG